MPQTNNSDIGFYMLVGIFSLFFLIIILVGLVFYFKEFSYELKLLNCEINRTTGSERRHWIRKRRRLWLSLIPFVKY